MAYSEEFQNTVINHFESIKGKLDDRSNEYRCNQLDRIQAMLDKNIDPVAKLQRSIDNHKYRWVGPILTIVVTIVIAYFVIK